MRLQTAFQIRGWGFWCCAVACAAILLLNGCGNRPPDDILERISGNWETEAEGYEGARMEISRRNLIYHTVNDTMTINRIADIRYAPDRYGDLLIIDYRNEFNQKYLLTFYLIASPEGDTLVKKTQRHIIWKKSPGESK